MHWRKRMGAIVMAGGSIAACSGEGNDAGLVQQNDTQVTLQPSRAPAAPSVPRVAIASDGLVTPSGYHIPICNANPDPCCRFPDMPECQRDAGAPPEDAAPDGACDAQE
jgi:hypothetical protein